MRKIDRLLLKATELSRPYDDVFVVNNSSGTWEIEGKEFPTLEAAEKYIDKVAAAGDVLLIVNDAGCGELQHQERSIKECGKNQIKNENANRSEADVDACNEYDCKWGNRQQNSEYYHSWV